MTQHIKILNCSKRLEDTVTLNTGPSSCVHLNSFLCENKPNQEMKLDKFHNSSSEKRNIGLKSPKKEIRSKRDVCGWHSFKCIYLQKLKLHQQNIQAGCHSSLHSVPSTWTLWEVQRIGKIVPRRCKSYFVSIFKSNTFVEPNKWSSKSSKWTNHQTARACRTDHDSVMLLMIHMANSYQVNKNYSATIFNHHVHVMYSISMLS